jgi:hypothetical protein
MSMLIGDGWNGAFLRRCANRAEVRVACRAACKAVATGGVQSPPHHRTLCHTCTSDWCGRLSGSYGWQVGPGSISYFQRFSITRTLKFESMTFPVPKIHQILQVDSLKHKEQLYMFVQLQIPSGLQVTNFWTNSNLNLPWILKGFKPFWKIW